MIFRENCCEFILNGGPPELCVVNNPVEIFPHLIVGPISQKGVCLEPGIDGMITVQYHCGEFDAETRGLLYVRAKNSSFSSDCVPKPVTTNQSMTKSKPRSKTKVAVPVNVPMRVPQRPVTGAITKGAITKGASTTPMTNVGQLVLSDVYKDKGTSRVEDNIILDLMDKLSLGGT